MKSSRIIFSAFLLFALTQVISSRSNTSLLSDTTFTKYCANIATKTGCIANNTLNAALTESQCEQRGCCWDDSVADQSTDDEYVPVCYRPKPYRSIYSAQVFDLFCSMEESVKSLRVCSGGPYYDPAECEAKGCCWYNNFESETKCYRPYSYQKEFNRECMEVPYTYIKESINETECYRQDSCWDHEKMILTKRFGKEFGRFDSLCYPKSLYNFYKGGRCIINPGMNFVNCNPDATTREECEATVINGETPCCWRNTKHAGVQCYYDFAHRQFSFVDEIPDYREVCDIPKEDRVPMASYLYNSSLLNLLGDPLYRKLQNSAVCKNAGGCFAPYNLTHPALDDYKTYCYRATDYKDDVETREECQFNLTKTSAPCTSKDILDKEECDRYGCCFIPNRETPNNFCFGSTTQLS